MTKTATQRSIARRAQLTAATGQAATKMAFDAGFRKAAEVMGVDPAALYKRADIKAQIAGLLGRTSRQIIRGGKAVKGGVRRVGSRLDDLLNARTAARYQEQVSSMDRLMGKMQGAGKNYVVSGTPEAGVWGRAVRQRKNALRRLDNENFLVGLTRTGYIGGVASLPVLTVAGSKRLADRYNLNHGYGQTSQTAQTAQG